MAASFEPEPSETEQEAILAALRSAEGRRVEGTAGEWAEAALLEGVESGEPSGASLQPLRRDQIAVPRRRRGADRA